MAAFVVAVLAEPDTAAVVGVETPVVAVPVADWAVNSWGQIQ